MSMEHEFRSDVRKVLNILTHSLYTNREIFLRELVSNASDALEKVRFLQNQNKLPHSDLPLEIKITADKEKNLLIIRDTGIGMTEAEMVENLGTIAKSGSEEFLKDLDKNADNTDAAQVIGRFGVGFYSVFMVSDKVEVISTGSTENALAHVWSSDGAGVFFVEEYKEEDAPKRGTEIRIYLKEDAKQFLEEYTLEEIVRKHSSFIAFPINLNDKQINTTPAIWREPKSSVTKEQYADFYKFLTYDSKEPLGTIHFSTDSPIQFNMLVFIPEQELDIALAQREQYGLDLYAKRVLINKDNKDLVPNYLAFLKGVVDTEDLPLNISRETLQENVVIRKIAQTVTKQTLKYLERIAKEDVELYNKIWRLHNKIFKLGYSDYSNQESFISLLRFNSSFLQDADDLTGLDAYIENGKKNHEDKQKNIWYIVAPNREACKLHPLAESFRRRNLEVLFLYEPIDEIVLEYLPAYKEFTFKAVEFANEEDLKDFPEKECGETLPPLEEKEQNQMDNLILTIKNVLKDQVKDVRVSTRLADSPAVLVGADGTSSSMDKLIRALNKDVTLPQKIFEVNANHPLIRNMLKTFTHNPDDPQLNETIHTLFQTSMLLDGYLQDPHSLVQHINSLLTKSSAWYNEISK